MISNAKFEALVYIKGKPTVRVSAPHTLDWKTLSNINWDICLLWTVFYQTYLLRINFVTLAEFDNINFIMQVIQKKVGL